MATSEIMSAEDFVEDLCYGNSLEKVLENLKARDAAIRAERDAKYAKVVEALVQITKRDDWTSGECRHHAQAALDELKL
jgi:hypothetical protein